MHPAFGQGPTIWDGTNMVPIGQAPVTAFSAYQLGVMPAAMHLDGSCDFIMYSYDRTGASGDIELWRINVTDGLVINSTNTGTLNVLPVFNPGTDLWIGQVNYDVAHDCIIFWAQDNINGPPTWLISANWDGSINWSRYLVNIASASDGGGRGQSLLTGTTMMLGNGDNLTMIDTETPAEVSPRLATK